MKIRKLKPSQRANIDIENSIYEMLKKEMLKSRINRGEIYTLSEIINIALGNFYNLNPMKSNEDFIIEYFYKIGCPQKLTRAHIETLKKRTGLTIDQITHYITKERNKNDKN